MTVVETLASLIKLLVVHFAVKGRSSLLRQLQLSLPFFFFNVCQFAITVIVIVFISSP